MHLEPGSSLLPVKKRMARMWQAEKKRRRLERAPNFVVVRLCSGEPVGTDPKALRQLGGQAVMDVDVRPEYLGWSGARVRVWTKKRRRELLRSIREHDYERDGPYKLAANLQAGWYVPEQLFDVDVGTLQGGMRDPNNDLNEILRAVRYAHPTSKLVVLASPPCRMYSVANSSSGEEDKEEYLKYTRRFLRKIAFSMRTGACDCVLVECSAPGRNDRKGNFVPGPAARALIGALNKDNHADNHTTFDVVKLDAADFGAYTTRKRLLFAPTGVKGMLPTLIEKWRGWGEPLGVCPTSNLRLVRGTWRCKKFAGVWPSDPGPTITTHHVFRYAHLRGTDRVTLVPLTAVERAKLMGCRADDPRLRALANLPPALARTVTGISFCAQWYLAVLSAAASWLEACTLDAERSNPQDARKAQQRETSEAFWRAEAERRALYATPVPGWAPVCHRLCVDILEGKCDAERQAVRARRIVARFCKV